MDRQPAGAKATVTVPLSANESRETKTHSCPWKAITFGLFTVSRRIAPGNRNNDCGSKHFLFKNFVAAPEASIQMSVLDTHISSVDELSWNWEPLSFT